MMGRRNIVKCLKRYKLEIKLMWRGFLKTKSKTSFLQYTRSAMLPLAEPLPTTTTRHYTICRRISVLRS